MVNSANQRAANAERSLREAEMQVEVLQAEVTALKALVITSTPAAPNPHLHPQLISKSVAETGGWRILKFLARLAFTTYCCSNSSSFFLTFSRYFLLADALLPPLSFFYLSHVSSCFLSH